MELIKGKYNSNDLVIINIWPTSKTNDNWANDLIQTELLCAPDLDGSTEAQDEGINILILRYDLPKWEEICNEQGLYWEESQYGDGGWEGVTLATADGIGFYWIEN